MTHRNKIALIIAGGRIVSKPLDNDPSGNYSSCSEEEILALLTPELQEQTFIIDWSRQPSGHYSLRMISDLVQLAAKHITDGASGVVVTCGAQGVAEIAYFADLIWSYPQPLIFVISTQFNHPECHPILLQDAVKAALSETCWGKRVLVLSNGALFPASDVTEISTHRSRAFCSPYFGTSAEFAGDNIISINTHTRQRILPIETSPARKVEVIYATVGGGEAIIASIQIDDIDGLVIAGLGEGEVPPSWIPYIKKLLKENITVVLTSRCIEGRVLPDYNFEGSPSRLIEMGVLSGGWLNPAQARIKLSLAIGAGLTGTDLQSYLLEDNI